MNHFGGDGITSHGLVFRASARIDLVQVGAQPVRMGQVAILLPRTPMPEVASLTLHARAARVRGIAMMLSARDACILECYAAECEAAATRLAAPQELARAA